MLNLFPNDEDANRLARQTFTLGGFLRWHAKDYQPPMLRRKAVVHGHCHHKSVLGMAPDMQLLDDMGLDYDALDSGCCGMAESFGFEAGERYEVSQKCGERVLLPAVREAVDDTLILADGFSCREQIAQGTERQALHLAEVLQLALRGSHSAAGMTPEAESAALDGDGADQRQRASGRARGAVTAILAGASLALLGGALIWRWRNGR